MNEEAINDAYELFVRNGYSKSPEEFRILMNRNENARRDVYDLFVEEGYSKSPEEFNVLMGIQQAPSGVETIEVETEVQEGPLKKKEGTVSPSGLSSLGLPSVTEIIEEKAAGPQETVEVETEVEVEAPQVLPSSDGEIKQSFLDRVVEKGQRSIDKKEEYQTYNPAVANKSATADFTQYKDYLPAGVKEIPNAKQVLEGDYNPVVPFDQAEYEKNPEAYQIIYNNKVKDYEEYLKGEQGYIKGYNGKYYSSDKFSPERILERELATLRSRDGNLMDRRDEDIVYRISERLGKFGFDVKYDPSIINIPEGRLGASATITSQHTGESIPISLDSFESNLLGVGADTDKKELDKLNAFVLKNFDEDKVDVKDLIEGLSAQDKAVMGAEAERKYETLSVGRTISDAEDMVVGIDKQIEAANKMLEEAQAMPDYEEAVSTSVGSGMLMGTSLRGVNKKKALKLKQAKAQLEYLNQQKKEADALLKSAEEGKRVQATKFASKVLGDQMMTESERLENEVKELSYISKVFTEVDNRLISNTERLKRLQKESYDEERKEWKSEEALQEAKDLIVEIGPDLKNRNELARIANEQQNDYRLDAENLRKDVGRKVILDAQVGGLTGSIVRSLASGAGSTIEGFYELIVGDLAPNIINMFYNEGDEGYITDAERKEFKKDSIQDDFVGYVSDKFGITDEAMEAYRYGLSLQDMIKNVKEGKQALEGSNWLTEGIYGMIESLPAISTGLIGGAPLMLPSFAAMGINGINKEMENNPMFANIPENEKLLLTLPYGVVIGVLETVGFRNVINNSSFVTNILLKSMNKFKGSTNRTFRETVIDVVQNKIQKGLILTAASGAAEFETGAAQKLAEGYMKEAYDVAKGMDYFKQSIDFLDGKYITKDFVDLIFHAGLSEMVGGIALGAIPAISQARKENTIAEIPIGAFMAYEKAMLDPAIRMAQMLKINSQVEQGLKTKEQAAKEIQDYDITIGQLRAIPQEFDLKSKQQILALKSQKKILEDQIEGKSVFTTREQQRQIKVLEERIEKVSANAQKGEAKKSNQDILTEEFVKSATKEEVVPEVAVEEEVTTEEAPVTEEEQEAKDKARAERLAELDRNLREATTEKAPVAETQEVVDDGKVPEVTKEQQDRYNNNEMSEQEIKDILIGLNTKVQMRSEGKTEEKITDFERKIKKENETLFREVLGMRAAPKTETKVETPKKKTPKKETGLDAKLRAIAVKMDKAAKEKVSSDLTKAEKELIKNNPKRFKEINDEVKMPTTTADGIRSAIKMVEDSFKEKEAKIKEQIKTIDDRVTDRMTKDKDRQKKKDELSKARKEKNAKVKELKAKLKDMGAKFRLSDDVATESPEGFITEDAIVEVMKGLGSAEANFKIPTGAKEKNVNPIAQSKSTKKITDAQAKKIGFKSVADMLKNIQEFNDIPMIVAMSDVLASGVVKDSMGNDMQVDGGMLYNVLGRNTNRAWAGVNKDGANTQFTEAKETYRANKELFDRLWKEGKLPNNHIPMVVVRMDDAAINSNEAMFRFMAPKLKSFSKEVQKIAFDTFLEQLESKKKSKSQEPLLIEAFIEKNNIKDLGTLFDLIVEDAKKRAQGNTETFSLTTKSYLLDMIASPVGVKKASKPVAKAIMNATDYNGEIFLIDNILSEIGEPSMLEGERGDAVAIVGVDISKEGGVKKVNHNNYGFGPKGRLIALIKNPTNVLEIFPEWRTKAFKMFELKPSTGKMKTDAQVLADVYGQVFGDKAFRGSRVTEEMSDIDMVSAQMRFAFPSVSVSKTQQEFDEALKQEGIRTAESNGNTILGLTKDGKIFLNPSRKSLSTPIHEFGHIWIDYLRAEESKTKGTKLLKRGLELVEGTKALESAIKKYGDNELAREEALVELMGTKGETIANAAKKAKFIEWFNAFFKYIKEKLTRFKDVKVKDIKNISLEDFVDIGLAELFSGEAVDAKFKPEEAATSAKARMQMEDKGIDLKGDMQTMINKAREEGFKDSEIKGVLKAIGYKARNINEALKVEIETDVTMPSIFGDIEGGAVKGQEMFTRLREKVAKFAKKNSPAKTREKAMELLREDQTYKEQSEKTKLELIKEFDKTLKSKANAKVRQEIAGIKQRIKDVTTGEVSIKDARTRLKNLIKDTLPKSREYSQSDINRLNKIVDDTTPKNYQAQVTKFFKQFNEIRGKQRKSKLQKLLKDIQAKAEQSKKKGARIAAEDQPFFKQAAVLVKAAIDGDSEVFAELADEMTEKEAEIFELFEKINNKEELTEKERELVAKAQAFDMLGKINNQELEALDDVIAAVKAETKASRERLKGKRLARKEIYDSLREQANKDISEGYPYLFDEVVNEDGSTSLVPLNDAQLRARRQQIRKNLLKDGKLVKNVREFFNLMFATEGKLVKGFFSNYLKHLGTLTNGLDRKGNFFTENIYKRLNRMEENNLKGYFSTNDAIDNNINTIDGIDNGLDGLYTTLNNSLSALNEDKIELKNVRLGSTNVVEKEVSLNKDEAARIIAISRNEQQRKRLKDQGIGEAEIKELEKFIGEPAVKAVDKIVDYLSSTYYESINKVYEDVNDVSLNYVENYFPVKTITEKTDKKRNAELATSLQEGKFSKVFSAQQASALKERNESKNPIAITGFSFTQELDTHITEMERFKAYAQGTKELNVIMNHTPSVKKLLDATNLDRVMSRGVGYAINPNAMQDLFRLNNPIFSGLQERFTGVALALKAIQLPKQASSFVNAFADYQLRDKGRIPILDTAADLVAFTLESAYVGFIKPRSTFKQAMDVSASFRNRMRQSFKTADLSGLETGQRATYGSGRTRRTKFARARRKAKIIANSPTLVGDAVGVMGYMVAYRNNIRKGMSPEEALERFNDYNATQQTRRATEKIGLQYDSNMIIRSFTMFGSTLFLQLNKVMQSATNIRRGTANAVTEGSLKEMPSTKDYRELFLNLGAANLLFTMISNIFKYNPFAAAGDDDDEIKDEDIDRVNKAKNALKRGKKISTEDQDLIDRYQFKLDKEQVLEQYKEAMFGVNQLYNLPLIGGTVNTAVDTWWWGYSDAIKKPRSRYTDPISQLFTSSYYDMVIGGKSGGETFLTRAFEYGLGVPSKAPLAAIDKLRSWFNSNDDYLRKEYEKKDEDGKRIAKEESFEKFKENRFEENMYDLLGISYSYRPGSAKSKDIIYVPIEVNKKSKDEDDSSSKPSKPQRPSKPQKPQRPQRPRRN